MDCMIDDRARRLSAQEIADYAEHGYVRNLPVFNSAGVAMLQRGFDELSTRLPDGIDINQVNCWHKASRWFYDLCCTPVILDYVEDLIGPDFFQWGGQFFVKYPGDGSVVPWHQDAQYWPLTPARAVTVWLAIHDADEGNSAMQVVRGSHRTAQFRHHTNDASNLVLDQEVSTEQFDADQVVTMALKAGEISLHDDGLLHGSGPNLSDRVRCGLTMRYCPSDVKCDLSVWPNFEAYPVRGTDRYRHNPVGALPSLELYPVAKFQHSSEFATVS
ncbi:MAG: non-heme Fe2+,alpha-ketoglutarate-dependent halogenase [Gammaproteobacteria bacterium]|jgi:non-heme Fe2+,alpha-ketoglutarate-dependent halogenase